uniref:Synaptogyrin-4 isoform X2 n=1 Tax=Geotrypetes seraphini TaxID=260995 RepID=A0A6P8STJ2_GEOSA|nr:synaptogyrin-4 isoform X2 [Geotrypetes seraphini]
MAFLSHLQWLLKNKIFLFVIKPLTLTRSVAWLFALVVSGNLVTEGYQNTPWSSELHCVLNSNPLACGYGIGVGLLGFLVCVIFLGLDAVENLITKASIFKAIIIMDLVVSMLWSFLWFIGFCFLTHQWALSDSPHSVLGRTAARISIAFSFFSIPCWVTEYFWIFAIPVRGSAIGRRLQRTTICMWCAWERWCTCPF